MPVPAWGEWDVPAATDKSVSGLKSVAPAFNPTVVDPTENERIPGPITPNAIKAPNGAPVGTSL